MSLYDLAAREQALDITKSCIVQAPAGSGKTELLIQRILKLLAFAVQQPEEILAITFTRKAALEMRHRLINALKKAQENQAIRSEHEQKTRDLALKVLKQNQRLNWHLLENPARLRIQTIDSLNAYLTRLAPVSSQLGQSYAIHPAPEELYQQAAFETLKHLDEQDQFAPAIEVLLRHLDNDLAKLARLISEMLARREQWLNYIFAHNPREALEKSWQTLINEKLQELKIELSQTLEQEWLELGRFAAQNLANDHPLKMLLNPHWQPHYQSTELLIWQALIQLLMTEEKSFRKRWDTRVGFPSPSATTDRELKLLYQTMKTRIQEWVGHIQEDATLGNLFKTILELPEPHYSDSQWLIIQALTVLLPLAVAHLSLQFQAQQALDYTEISLRALRAMGEDEQVSDIALKLDYHIQHILVDEFQDTSVMQYELLKKLTAGWETDDGRSLFIVGDPMQSIYRFRKAEVGLFLQVRLYGLEQIRLNSLKLSCNFRSQAPLITWFNHCFGRLMPVKEEMGTGAIAYHPSHAMNESSEAAVFFHAGIQNHSQSSAEQVVQLIEQLRCTHPALNIAVLVQSRSQVQDILSLLKQKKLPVQAIEIEHLGTRPIIQDLLALTRALWHPGDRVAWFALLRAPWCGLRLEDLIQISLAANDTPLWEVLSKPHNLNLSADGLQRLESILPCLKAAMLKRGRVLLSRLVRQLWKNLYGDQCLSESSELTEAERYFQLLMELEQLPAFDPHLLQKRLNDLKSSSASIEIAAIELMTIHKSKGLEFDIVILPGLDRKTQQDQHQLMLWEEWLSLKQTHELLLAPIKRYSYEQGFYHYLRQLEQQKARQESLRVLYVACTRARHQLHLMAELSLQEPDRALFKKPRSGSLLAELWPATEAEWLSAGQIAFHAQATHLVSNNSDKVQVLKRFSLATLANLKLDSNPPVERFNPVERFVWKNNFDRAIGTLVHLLLEQLAVRMKQNNFEPIAWLKHYHHSHWLRHRLSEHGIANTDFPVAEKKIILALENALNDPQALWLLQPHTQAASELPVSLLIQGRMQNFIIDRTFIHENTRWIIDFKTSVMSEGQSREEFLTLERNHYQTQLESYAKAFCHENTEKIELALYYPFLKYLDHWTFCLEELTV